jgi:Arc/MetJ family transcription regulator
MAKTSVEIDMAQLAQVRGILGTDTIRDTINAAFREVIRVKAARNLVQLAHDGAFAALLEPDIEERLWG